MIRFGSHCSLKKGLSGALEEAHSLGCEAVQIFTRSPRMWKMRFPSDTEINEFKENRKHFGIYPLVVHTPYLPNLAALKDELYARSVQALRDDISVCKKLEADYLVIHPGSYSEDSSAEEGISRIASAINLVFSEISGKTLVLLENVSGGGRRLGGSFKELSLMLDKIKDKKRVGICLDTAHAFGRGYDLSSEKGVNEAIKEFDGFIGLDKLKVLHFNDSMVPLSSMKDRHQHLGKGYIGSKGFKCLVNLIKEKAAAGIIETPKDLPGADARNLALLFKWRS